MLFVRVPFSSGKCNNNRMAIYEKSIEYRKLGQEVIREHEDLRWIREQKIRIAYLESDLEKKKAGGRQLVFAECKKVPDLYKAFIPYDFIIVFYQPNVQLMDDDSVRTLMRHELMHVGLSDTGQLYVVPHDVEEFDRIIEDCGLHWAVM